MKWEISRMVWFLLLKISVAEDTLTAAANRSRVLLDDPFDLRGRYKAPLAQGTGYDVEVIHFESAGSGARVMTSRHQSDIVIFAHRLVQRTTWTGASNHLAAGDV
jgi:hypothetical protein